MRITFAAPALPTSGRLIVPIFDHGELPSVFSKLLSKATRQTVERALEASGIASGSGEQVTLFALPGLGKAALTVWSAGPQEAFDAEMFGAEVMAAFRTGGDRTLAFHLNELAEQDIVRVAVGARLAAYRFDKHRSQQPPGSATTITALKLHAGEPARARKRYQSFEGPVCDGQLLARDLVNEPANVLFPKAYAQRIKALKASGLQIEVLGEKAMKELKMGALLGVGQGSPRESQLVVVKWKGGKARQAPVCLVGKGITFDSGGISLKPKDGMWNMKGDMGGSAAVVGTMQALALRKAKVNVIGIVALAENMPDGNAQNPGDVITSMSGQTIELQSTDAEGRLVLADALWYAKEKFRPRSMVDLATLTGAKVIALGSEHAGLFSNSDKLADQFASSSITARERTWRLPLLPEYDRLLDSETADMKNSVAGGAGAITAAQFLQRYVGEVPWVHLDIAGSSHKLTRSDPREPSFAIGFGVRLLNQWLADPPRGIMMIAESLTELTRISLLALLLALSADSQAASPAMEALAGEGVWTSPLPRVRGDGPLKATVWFDRQWLGDGKAYERRATEFADAKRTELRAEVIRALKTQSTKSHAVAADALDRLLKAGTIQKLDRHWIINGFSCHIRRDDVAVLKTIPGARKIFFEPLRERRTPAPPKWEPVPPLTPPEEPSFEKLPWYVGKLKADRVWKELGIAGAGTLNVIHDKNFIFSEHLSRTVYRNPKEIPGNGIDDDGNGYIDDAHGYNFDRGSAELYTLPFSGNPKDRKTLHGTSCATIASGAAAPSGAPQFGIAPLSRWAGVINQGGIERSVEWAIEQGADTYSMSFSRMYYGDYQSHWRKVMEHGSFCGLYFVSGAGNRRSSEPEPFRMNIPQSIPNAVFAAAGVQRDLSKTEFSCVGPVRWQTEHYQDGAVQKPEVCAFNARVSCLFPDGRVVPDLLNGNSYAGPMFCGAISLMLSADPDLLPWDLQEIITSTATDVGPEGIDYETGHGLIDCHAAVKEVLRRKASR